MSRAHLPASHVSPDLPRLLADILARLDPRPVALVNWQAEVLTLYAGKARTTRLRMGQAIREAITLARSGGGSNRRPTTAALTPGLVARLAGRAGAAATTNGLLSALRAACRIAEGRGWIAPGQLAGASWTVPADPPRRRHHGRAALARVLEFLRGRATDWEGWRLYALVAVLAYTGLRRNEALRLKVVDVRLDLGFIFVRRHGRRLKTDDSAAPVPIPHALAPILRGWLAQAGPEWLFPGIKRLGPWTGGAAGRRAADRVKQAGEAVGVPGLTPHTLRHSLATHLRIAWGLTPKQIQMILRHSDEFTQEFYIHPDLEDLAELVHGFDFAAPARRPQPRRGRVLPLKRLRRRAG